MGRLGRPRLHPHRRRTQRAHRHPRHRECHPWAGGRGVDGPL